MSAQFIYVSAAELDWQVAIGCAKKSRDGLESEGVCTGWKVPREIFDTIDVRDEARGRIDNRGRGQVNLKKHIHIGELAPRAMGSGVEMEEAGTANRQEAGATQSHVAKHHDSGLLMIGVFKLVEAVFFLLVGVGAIHFIHHDLGEAAQRLAERLRFDPDRRAVAWVLDQLDDITAHRLRQIGVATFFYAGLRVTEGVGLVLEKRWAEYLTVGLTTVFLPWELYEIVRHTDWLRVGLLVVNLLVLAYLIWWLRRNRKTAGAQA